MEREEDITGYGEGIRAGSCFFTPARQSYFLFSPSIKLYLVLPMPVHILIVDDEPLSSMYLQDMVQEFAPESIIHEAGSAKEAISLLEHEVIDILFSDIKMPGIDGFDMLQQWPQRDFELVFVTAYSEYALPAFKEAAAAYILKPVQKDEFRKILLRLIRKREEQKRMQLESLLSNRLAISYNKGVKFIPLRDILYLEGANTYTTVVLADGMRFVSSKPMQRFEQTLDSYWFFRIHKSYLVNIYHFTEYLSAAGDQAQMSDGSRLPVSRYRLAAFLQKVQAVSGRLKI